MIAGDDNLMSVWLCPKPWNDRFQLRERARLSQVAGMDEDVSIRQRWLFIASVRGADDRPG